eukprot:gene19865-21806_t
MAICSFSPLPAVWRFLLRYLTTSKFDSPPVSSVRIVALSITPSSIQPNKNTSSDEDNTLKFPPSSLNLSDSQMIVRSSSEKLEVLTYCVSKSCLEKVVSVISEKFLCSGCLTCNKCPETPDEIIEEKKAEENDDNASKGKFFYQGDIRLTKPQKEKLDKKLNSFRRDVSDYDDIKWPDPQNIKYQLDSTIDEWGREAIEGAMFDFHRYTCLRFHEMKPDDKDKDFIRFIKEDG